MIEIHIYSRTDVNPNVPRSQLECLPIVQPPYQDVIDSGNVVAKSETPLATVPIVVVVRKGDSKRDNSSPDAVKRLLLAAKANSYLDGAGGSGGAAGSASTRRS